MNSLRLKAASHKEGSKEKYYNFFIFPLFDKYICELKEDEKMNYECKPKFSSAEFQMT